jgi:hypothetical protein
MNHFNNAIYLPMLIKILEMDLHTIEETQLKFKRPYARMIDQALKQARSKLKESNVYLPRNNMKLYKKSRSKEFTEYIFSVGAYEEIKKYPSGELKERTEEIMSEYLSKFEI